VHRRQCTVAPLTGTTKKKMAKKVGVRVNTRIFQLELVMSFVNRES
jgi:hypothetical protein